MNFTATAGTKWAVVYNIAMAFFLGGLSYIDPAMLKEVAPWAVPLLPLVNLILHSMTGSNPLIKR